MEVRLIRHGGGQIVDDPARQELLHQPGHAGGKVVGFKDDHDIWLKRLDGCLCLPQRLIAALPVAEQAQRLVPLQVGVEVKRPPDIVRFYDGMFHTVQAGQHGSFVTSQAQRFLQIVNHLGQPTNFMRRVEG